MGEAEAKAGRVQAARNEVRLRESVDELEHAGWNPVARKRVLARLRDVLEELDRYVSTDN